MENASKALIIAGAILLSILIIALGMQVYNSASSSVGKADMSSQEISSHNATFEAYEGRLKGSQVKALVNAIMKNNQEYEDRPIVIDFSGTEYAADKTEELIKSGNIKSSTTYSIEFDYEGNDGLISKCTVKVYGT